MMPSPSPDSPAPAQGSAVHLVGTSVGTHQSPCHPAPGGKWRVGRMARQVACTRGVAANLGCDAVHAHARRRVVDVVSICLDKQRRHKRCKQHSLRCTPHRNVKSHGRRLAVEFCIFFCFVCFASTLAWLRLAADIAIVCQLQSRHTGLGTPAAQRSRSHRRRQ